MLRFLRTFGRNDLRVVSRDSFMLWAGSFPLVLWIPVRVGVPRLDDWLSRTRDFDLEPYYPLILTMLPILAIPFLLGLLFGLLVLDERDNNTLAALQVTPMSMRSYAVYRVALPAAYGFLITLPNLVLVGIVPSGTYAGAAAMALGCIFVAPVVAMGLAAFARNKIEAITVFRGVTLFVPLTLVAYFVESDWQYAFGINPVFWPMKAWWTYVDDGNGLPYLVVGLAYGLVLSALLIKRFRHRLGETSAVSSDEADLAVAS
jgi:fluoroquinolone transport system permease protein